MPREGNLNLGLLSRFAGHQTVDEIDRDPSGLVVEIQSGYPNLGNPLIGRVGGRRGLHDQVETDVAVGDRIILTHDADRLRNAPVVRVKDEEHHLRRRN